MRPTAELSHVRCAPAMAKTAGIILVGNEILSGKIERRQRRRPCAGSCARSASTCGASPSSPTRSQLIAAEVRAFSRRYDVVFTSGGVGPTHDDVTIEGVARALDAPVVRHPLAGELLERYYRGQLNEARLEMAEVPEGAELVRRRDGRFPGGDDAQRLHPARRARDLPPEVRGAPRALPRRAVPPANVFVSIGEGTLADYLNRLLAGFPQLLLGSYPEFSNPEYKVKVTLESKDRGYLDGALTDFLGAPAGRRGRSKVTWRAGAAGIPLAVAIVAAALYLRRARRRALPRSARRHSTRPSPGDAATPGAGSRRTSTACPTSTSPRCSTGSWRPRSPGSARPRRRRGCGPRSPRSAWRRSPRASASARRRRGSGCWPGSGGREPRHVPLRPTGQAGAALRPASCWPSPASSLAYRGGGRRGLRRSSTAPRPGRADQGLPRRGRAPARGRAVPLAHARAAVTARGRRGGACCCRSRSRCPGTWRSSAVPRLPLVHGGRQSCAELRAPARVPRRGRAAGDAPVPRRHRARRSCRGRSRCRGRRPGVPAALGRRRRRGSGCCSASGRSCILGFFALSPFKLPHYGLPAFPRWRCWWPALGRFDRGHAGRRRAPSLMVPIASCSRSSPAPFDARGARSAAAAGGRPHERRRRGAQSGRAWRGRPAGTARALRERAGQGRGRVRRRDGRHGDRGGAALAGGRSRRGARRDDRLPADSRGGDDAVRAEPLVRPMAEAPAATPRARRIA